MRRIIVTLLLSLLLAGCAAPPEEAPAVPAPEVRTAAAPADMSSSMVESSARPPLETEVLAAYDQALRVYGWFDLAPLPASEETAVVDHQVYSRVDMEGVEELADLRAYLRSVFSQELADQLLDGGTARIQYRDVDGALYVLGTRRDRVPGKGQVQVEAEQMGETVYSVNVLVELLDEDGKTVVGLESWSFPYEFVDGRWVFTDFGLVY